MGKVLIKRNEDIDILKGILIFLVVWGHCIQYGIGFGVEWKELGLCVQSPVHRLIYSFHMPLFMGVSGYLFYFSNKKKIGQISSSRMSSIVVPWLFYCLLMAITMIAIDTPFVTLGGAIKRFLSCCRYSYWFLLSLLVNSIIVCIVTRLINDIMKQYLLFVMVGLIFIVCFVEFPNYSFVYPFFVAGYIMNQQKVTIHLRRWMLIPAIMSITIVPFLYTPEHYIYKGMNNIFDDDNIISYPLLLRDIQRFFYAIINCIAFLILFKSIPFKGRLKRGLIMIGRHSIGIYCLSSIIQRFEFNLIGNVGHIYAPNILTPLIDTIIIILLCESVFYVTRKSNLLRLVMLGGR